MYSGLGSNGLRWLGIEELSVFWVLGGQGVGGQGDFVWEDCPKLLSIRGPIFRVLL